MWPFKKKERRHFARRPVHLDVMYGPAPPLTLTTSIDMSAHSLAFRSSQNYTIGEKLEVQVLLDAQHPENGWFYSKAKVMRCEKGVVAVDFTSMASEDERKIDLYFSRMEDVQPTA